MKTSLVFFASLFLVAPAFASGFYANVICKAVELRINGTDVAETYVDSKLYLSVVQNKKTKKVSLSDYQGHVYVQPFDGQEVFEQGSTNYYASFSGKDLAATLSPRARAYPDSKYLRFNDFDSPEADMWGYLVVSRKALEKAVEGETFDAHYVAQAEDHFGGTVDYTCFKD